MCIAVYKPTGAKFPTKKTLKTCFNNNPDGAGFMYADGNAVHIEKGFFTFSAFWKALQRTRATAGDGAPFVLHFRISTQGGIRADCCHPFPLADSIDDLRPLSTVAPVGIAHNGVISLTATHGVNVDYSDTMEFIAEYLSRIIQNGRTPTNIKTLELIEKLCASRLAILDARGVCRLLGDGWRNDGGAWYSNGSYKEYKPAPVWYGFNPLTDCTADDFDACDTCPHWRECMEYYAIN